MWLAWCHAELGEFSDALAFADEGVRIADEVGQLYSRIIARFGMGVAHLRKGDLPQAIGWLETARDLHGTSDMRAWRPWIVSSLGLAYALAGRPRDALSMAREALSLIGGTKGPSGSGLIWVGEVHLRAGLPDEANRIAVEAMEFFRGDRGREAELSALLGAISLA